MRRFLLGWKVLGHAVRLDAHIVNYADDLTILCRGTAEAAMNTMREMMGRLKLTGERREDRLCRVPDSSFNFLGYSFGRCYSAKSGRAYIGTRAAKKSIAKACRAISELTSRSWLLIDAELQVAKLNRHLTGWANYFCQGPVSKAYRAIDSHAVVRLRRWLCKKHKTPGRGMARYPDELLYQDLGLKRLAPTTRALPWAKA